MNSSLLSSRSLLRASSTSVGAKFNSSSMTQYPCLIASTKIPAHTRHRMEIHMRLNISAYTTDYRLKQSAGNVRDASILPSLYFHQGMRQIYQITLHLEANYSRYMTKNCEVEWQRPVRARSSYVNGKISALANWTDSPSLNTRWPCSSAM